ADHAAGALLDDVALALDLDVDAALAYAEEDLAAAPITLQEGAVQILLREGDLIQIRAPAHIIALRADLLHIQLDGLATDGQLDGRGAGLAKPLRDAFLHLGEEALHLGVQPASMH